MTQENRQHSVTGTAVRRRIGALALAMLCLPIAATAQRIDLPAHLPSAHPRVAALPGCSHDEIVARLKNDPAAQSEVTRAEAELAPYMAYTKTDPMWLASRLQMYWKSHATDVYNRGDVFDHVEGHAPVATVRYPGSRDPLSAYEAPKLEDIPPYEDDTKGVLLVNRTLPNHPLEWASPAKSGRVIDGINSRILHMAANAARLYWLTGDEAYARFAAPVLDVYLQGMRYRREPIDLTHGHSQTIYGMSTFEVIQEGWLQDVAATYDFLHDYVEKHDAAAIPLYTDALRQWVDVTVHNGVPFNNWDLIEARFIASVALVLEDDSRYADGRGEQHYLNYVLNDSVTRQWSIGKLADRGYDPKSAIWFESSGYSMGVIKDFVTLINDLDAPLGMDLLPRFPIFERAVLATGQYLYPNGYTVSFGDGHHVLLASAAAREMVKNAQRHHRREQELRFTAMVKLLEANAAAAGHAEAAQQRRGLETIFTPETEHLDPSIAPMQLSELVSPTFSAPSVSYFVQRNGLDAQNGLMAAEAGSLGNHQHANGITLELYGRGMVLAPESGLGTNYFEIDHAQYYSQFVASNTVAVDGISSYPTMKSHHGFDLIASYPAPSDRAGKKDTASSTVTFSDVYFHEPETDADQRRLVSIVRTSEQNGYYVDIFRSRRRDGRDKMHDYFFHGLGQDMSLTDAHGVALAMQPTEELTFADEELDGYDYFWDKHSIRTAQDYRARFALTLPQRAVQMNLWMAGSDDREIFQVKAPASHAVGEFLPKAVAAMPMPTLVARQFGEAWTHPFAVVFEPTDDRHPSTISSIERFTPQDAPKDFVGLTVHNADGSRQWIFNSTEMPKAISFAGVRLQGTYAVAGDAHGKEYLFLGKGMLIARDGIVLELPDDRRSAELHYGEAEWHITCPAGTVLTVATDRLSAGSILRVSPQGVTPLLLKGIATTSEGKSAMRYTLPATEDAVLRWTRDDAAR